MKSKATTHDSAAASGIVVEWEAYWQGPDGWRCAPGYSVQAATAEGYHGA